MNFFVYPGAAGGTNLGDLAMLQVALDRLAGIWPGSRFNVLTRSPEYLATHCPGSHAVNWRGCKRWLRIGALPRLLFPGVPPSVSSRLPLAPSQFGRVSRLIYPPDYLLARRFAETLFQSDVLVLSGCGILTDVFRAAALQILNTFDAAQRAGLATVLLGQGIGPIQDTVLLETAARVLPRLNALFLRESAASSRVLEGMKVSDQRLRTTGDDTVELAFAARQPDMGMAIGVNLRGASYAELEASTAEKLAAALVDIAARHGARLLGVPVMCGEADGSDVRLLRRLFPVELNRGEDIRAPLDLIRRIAGCRLVVAGSYHAGVFALSQGIPVIGIVRSKYYADKFDGLRQQFGEGCVVLRADEPDASARLASMVESLWNDAARLRPLLLEAAERQVRSGQTAYQSLRELIGRRD